uniref:CRAL-TRIO domain-containing protein n=1 Tax=Timema poppense TaxID=170557 RepID=A0A7R9DN91_TIMPO|nr:unnamed protein product [Timema poppensis]
MNGGYLHLCGGRGEKHFGKTTLNTLDKDSNLDLPVIGILVYCESDAFTHEVTERDAMPLRLKEVHMVNQPFIFNAVFQLFKPFIREKLKARMYFHGKKMESLHKYMNPDHLPEDYGGKKPKIDYTSKDWYPLLEELEDTIREWNSFGIVQP